MSLWNPYAFTPTGQPVAPVAPPALRVIDGQATAQQLAHAQDAFYRFCASARLSAVPNPTEIGALPDGSRYRIVVVGPVATMFLWPVADESAFPRGVGVRAVFAGGPALFLLTYRKGKWKVEAVDEFYGGSGLWVGTNGRYLTDDTLSLDASLVSTRHFTASTADLPVGLSHTSVRSGLAYSNSRNVGAGIFTRSGKYALIVPNYGLSVDILEAEVLPESDFAKTPTEAAQEAQYLQSLELVGPKPAMGITTLKGRAKYSRLRDGSAMFFPVVDASSGIVARDLAADGWLSPLPLTHEFKVNLQGNGYSAELVQRADPEVDEQIPTRTAPTDIYAWWTGSLHQSLDQQLLGTTNGAYTLPLGETTLTGEALQTATILTELRRLLDLRRLHNWERPVYFARNWQGDAISMTAESQEVRRITVEFSEDFSRTEFPIGTRVEIYAPPVVSYGDMRGIEFVADAVTGFSLTRTRKTSYQYSLKTSLGTPWDNLFLEDRDSKLTINMTYEVPGDTIVTFSVAEETPSVYREIRFIDPVLDLIGFIEITTGGYESLTNAVTTVGSTAKFVLRHKSETLLEIPLPAPDEGVSTNVIGSLSYFEGITAREEDIVFANTEFPGSYSRPFKYVYAQLTEGGTVFDYILGTEIRYIPRARYEYEYPSPYRMAPSDAPSFVHPRPTLPPEKCKVSVRAALDPNSGGGVVLVHDDNTFMGGWAIAPNGSVTPIEALVAKDGELPSTLHKLVVSV